MKAQVVPQKISSGYQMKIAECLREHLRQVPDVLSCTNKKAAVTAAFLLLYYYQRKN